MEDSEYTKFMQYVFEKYVEPRLSPVGSMLKDPLYNYDWDREWIKLRDACRLLRCLSLNCKETEEIYETFRPERLDRLKKDVTSSCQWHFGLAERSGFLEALDAHLDQIVEGLKPEHLPEEEKKILKELGSFNPELDLSGMAQVAKTMLQQPVMPPTAPLKGFSDGLTQLDISLNIDTSKKEKRSRRWWKGLGGIATGIGVSIANIGIASTTQAWAALSSAAVGFGTVMQGIGELSGE